MNNDPKTFKRLVLSGGSIKGIAYIGALKYFEENKLRFGAISEFVGTSIGSLSCLLIILNYTSAQLKKIFWDLDFNDLQDISMVDFMETFGLDDGKLIENFVKKCILDKGLSENITFSQLKELTGKSLIVCGTNVNHQSCRFFDYKSSPNMPIFLALKISMAIPILFQPVSYENELYVDGGITNDIPVNYPCEDNSTTLCVRLKEVNRGVLGGSNYFYNLLKTSFKIINENSKAYAILQGITFIEIAVDIRHGIDFGLDLEQKDYLYNTGYSAVKNAFI